MSEQSFLTCCNISARVVVIISACVGGTYKDTTGSNNCTDCGPQETTENIARTQEADCICIEGYTFDGNNCIQCASGTYKTDIGDNTCDICPQYSNSPQGSILLTDCSCNAGYSGPDGGNCIACALGKFKLQSGSQSCSDCLAGEVHVHTNARWHWENTNRSNYGSCSQLRQHALVSLRSF